MTLPIQWCAQVARFGRGGADLSRTFLETRDAVSLLVHGLVFDFVHANV